MRSAVGGDAGQGNTTKCVCSHSTNSFSLQASLLICTLRTSDKTPKRGMFKPSEVHSKGKWNVSLQVVSHSAGPYAGPVNELGFG